MRKRASVDDHSVGTLGRAVAASAQSKVPVWGIFVGPAAACQLQFFYSDNPLAQFWKRATA